MKTINIMKYYLIIQIAYAPHATKHTLTNLIKLVHPERIHPLYLPAPNDDEWSNVIPNDIVPKIPELVIPREIETFGEMENNAGMEGVEEDLENSFKLAEKSFLASSDSDEYLDVYVKSTQRLVRYI